MPIKRAFTLVLFVFCLIDMLHVLRADQTGATAKPEQVNPVSEINLLKLQTIDLQAQLINQNRILLLTAICREGGTTFGVDCEIDYNFKGPDGKATPVVRKTKEVPIKPDKELVPPEKKP